ncbi:MAG: alpha-(1-_3)-arabinofuranosyltransferase domain-containing protein [Solirubrobacteraceae bacterium]
MLPGLVALSYLACLLQRPGSDFHDSRIELSVNPALFLHRVAELWSPTTDVGHVQAAQSVGYLLPMGPWFAFGHWIGLSMWLIQRLWLGTLVAVAVWGAVRLLDALFDRRRGPAHLAAGLIYGFNPYVAVFINRTSVALLAYVILPWLLLAVHQGVREPRRWRWPAVLGLLLALSGGGTNATFTVITVLAPLALLAYEAWVIGRGSRAAAAFGWRALVCAAAGSAWWVVPAALSVSYGHDFLSFTEQPGAIWTTSSMSEALRLLGYWPLYLRIGFGAATPIVAPGDAYLFHRSVILGTFLVPLLAFGGLVWTRRWSYAPFFGLLAVVGLVVMAAGFPPGAPARGVLLNLYYDVPALQILRTTYKAAPLVAIGLAMLGGVAVQVLVRAARDLHPAALAGTALVLAATAFAFGLPLFKGSAINRADAYGSIPPAWPAAVADATRGTNVNQRIMLLPGELFSSYSWGTTDEPLAPALTRRPVLVRAIARYADPRGAQLQAAVDDLVQQVRLVPGQLQPLLQLLGVGQVLVATDGRREANYALDPVGVARALKDQSPFFRPAAGYGPQALFAPEPGRSGPLLRLPELRRYAVPGGPGVVRAHPQADTTILDGDGDGVAELAAVGGLRTDRALLYASDVGRARLADLVRRGASLVLTDSNRRRTVAAARLTENYGATLGAHDPIARDWPHYDPFPSRGPAGRTVAVYSGLRYLRAPLGPAGSIFPEQRPYAAMDGRLSTRWLGDPYDQRHRELDLALAHPRPVPYIDIHPHQDPLGATTLLGITVNGGHEHDVAVRPGWNRIPLASSPLDTLRVRIKGVSNPFFAIPGGIDELAIPGVRVREALRLPTVLASEARGLDLSGSRIDVVLRRTTADDPYQAGGPGSVPQEGNRLDMVDAEPGLERDVTLPAARTFDPSGWASVDPAASEPQLDALAGMPGGWRFASSSRFEGLPIRRASSAFDGRRQTAWIGDLRQGQVPWLAWRAPRPVRLDRVRLLPGPAGYFRPADVRLVAPGFRQVARVAPDGTVRLRRALRTRSLRVEILGTHATRTSTPTLPAVAISELQVPGLRPPRPRRRGHFSTACGSLHVSAAGGRADLQVVGDLAALDRGRPLRLRACGPRRRLALPEGVSALSAPGGAVMRPDHLLLSSPPTASPPASGTGGAPPLVLAPHATGTGAVDRVRLRLTEPSWLVLGQGYGSGWRATCRDSAGHEHDLGRPVPIDGFANGWRADASCREAEFRFAPQRVAVVAYAFSAAGIAAMLALLVLTSTSWLRARRPRAAAPRLDAAAGAGPLHRTPADPLRKAGWRAGVAAGAVVAAVAAGVFALRMGAVLGVATVVLVRFGFSARRLLWLGAALLAVIPVLYVAMPATRFDNYADHYLTAHWFAVAAVCCIGAGCVVAIHALRTSGRS